MRGLGLLLAVAVSLGACTTDPEATRLGLPTEVSRNLPGTCTLGAIPPFRIERDGSDMVFEDIGTGERRSIIWPVGFAAWLEFGVAVLYASDGSIVGRQGDVLESIGAVVTEGGYRVCGVGVRSY